MVVAVVDMFSGESLVCVGTVGFRPCDHVREVSTNQRVTLQDNIELTAVRVETELVCVVLMRFAGCCS